MSYNTIHLMSSRIKIDTISTFFKFFTISKTNINNIFNEMFLFYYSMYYIFLTALLEIFLKDYEIFF